MIVLALRADFYARCAAYPGLARLVGANNVIVGPMSQDELRRAITQPAERVGLRVDADLEDAMIADVDGQPGALPLLSTALLELWQLRRGGRLQLAGVPTDRWSPRCRGAARRGRVRQLQPAEQAALANFSCVSPTRTSGERSSAGGFRWRSSAPTVIAARPTPSGY